MNKQDFKIGQKYFVLYGLILSLLICGLSYIILHSSYQDHQGILHNLNGEEIEILIELKEREFSELRKTYTEQSILDTQEIRVPSELSLRYLVQNEGDHAAQLAANVSELLNSSGYNHLVSVQTLESFYDGLHSQKLEKDSYFFLKDEFLLLEILFWALFGVICNSLYNAAEFIRKRKFDPNESTVYFVKFLYAPLVSLVIYLAFDLIGGEQASATPTNTVVLAFLLGFFSGRSIELLHRLKEVILPARGKEQELKEGQTDHEFWDLPVGEQRLIIYEYIELNDDHLKKEYPEIQSISIREKHSNTENLAIHFDLLEKIPFGELSNPIPTTLEYIYQGKNYHIPTNIDGVGENQPESQYPAKYSGEHVYPKELGLSCSRRNTDHMGTIGLKIKKGDKFYLLGCYHVLCAPELYVNKQTSFHKSLQNNHDLLSPGEDDGTNNRHIASVSEGTLNSYVDAAIAELIDDGALLNKLHKEGTVSGTRILTSDDRKKKTQIKMYGRTSGRRFGNVIDNYVPSVFVDEGYPAGTLSDNKFKNLIKTTKISRKGDSGSVVVDINNQVIGLIVAGNKSYSYVIPIQTILNHLNIQMI